jgi:hypothetical protein
VRVNTAVSEWSPAAKVAAVVAVPLVTGTGLPREVVPDNSPSLQEEVSRSRVVHWINPASITKKIEAARCYGWEFSSAMWSPRVNTVEKQTAASLTGDSYLSNKHDPPILQPGTECLLCGPLSVGREPIPRSFSRFSLKIREICHDRSPRRQRPTWWSGLVDEVFELGCAGWLSMGMIVPLTSTVGCQTMARDRRRWCQSRTAGDRSCAVRARRRNTPVPALKGDNRRSGHHDDEIIAPQTQPLAAHYHFSLPSRPSVRCSSPRKLLPGH